MAHKMDSAYSPEKNKHHTGTYQSEAEFLDQFRYDPDYPDTAIVTDFRELAWYKENS